MQVIKKIIHLKPIEYLLFAEAFFYSIFCRITILFIPLKMFASLMGSYMHESVLESYNNYPKARRIATAINRVRRVVPWRCMCYEQAFMGKLMLNKRNIPTTIYFGVCKDQQDKMLAHAWLRCGDKIITGKKGMMRFTVVASFA